MEFGTSKSPPNDAAASGVITATTSAGFAQDVIEASKTLPVIVDFWAPWCGPCKQLTPILEKAVRAQNGKVRLVKINVDENQAIAAQLRVQSIPSVYAFRDGQPVDGFAGGQPEDTIKEFVARLIDDAEEGDGVEAVLATGHELLDQGDLQGAAEVFASILQEDRENAEALAGLAKCYMQSGDTWRAKQTIALVPPEKRLLASVQSVIANVELSEKAEASGDLNVLAVKVAGDPKDLQSRYDLAVGLAASGQRQDALDHLLEIVKLEPKWNEEAARKQLLQFFEAWGPKEPLVAEGRRRLSSLLFR